MIPIIWPTGDGFFFFSYFSVLSSGGKVAFYDRQ